MPIYEYACLSCGKSFEILQSLNSDIIVTCEFCMSEKVEKKISIPSVKSDQPVWDKHSDFIKKLKPKYVKDGVTGKRKRLR